ncbi:hypothetical protein [Herbiconiux liangxiaofengii]|uniref:hypothetical protein n=1 Tax=Herbiconiux liangxiaofengii TaxID=3342795 RepID=UPI0035B977BA
MTLRGRIETPVKALLRRRLLADRFAMEHFSYSEAGSRAPQPVLICLWNRPTRLADVIAMLDSQLDVPDGVELHIWNNNKLDHDHYRDVLRRARPTGALRSAWIARTPYNLGSIGRFYLARRIAAERGSTPVIVIDDDEVFDSSFVSVAQQHFDPKAITAWWAFSVGDAYFARVPAEPGGRVDHIGPGGSVMDAAIFSDRSFFTDIPDRYLYLDDLWLTWWARDRGYTLAKLPVEISMVMDETNQYHGLLDLKEEFFDVLYPDLAAQRRAREQAAAE